MRGGGRDADLSLCCKVPASCRCGSQRLRALRPVGSLPALQQGPHLLLPTHMKRSTTFKRPSELWSQATRGFQQKHGCPRGLQSSSTPFSAKKARYQLMPDASTASTHFAFDCSEHGPGVVAVCMRSTTLMAVPSTKA